LSEKLLVGSLTLMQMFILIYSKKKIRQGTATIADWISLEQQVPTATTMNRMLRTPWCLKWMI